MCRIGFRTPSDLRICTRDIAVSRGRLNAPPWSGRYRDIPTGFEGDATARTEYLAGNVNLCLERLDNNGDPTEAWFSEQRLERIDPQPSRPGF